MTPDKTFDGFSQEIEKTLLNHKVIIANPYTKWFKLGEANPAQVMDLFRQFSVFSNYFLIIQCKNMVFAETMEEETGARGILGSELGVSMDVETGDIEGKKFGHRKAHINWLRETAEPLCQDFNIDPKILGRWSLGYHTTHEFLKRLECYYASPDRNRRAGATFAVEQWAAFGIGHGEECESNNFWRELVVGLEKFNKIYRRPKKLKPINPKFFQWHFDIELGHAHNVMDQLRAIYVTDTFDPELWLEGGEESLDALSIFWDGLNEARLRLAV